MPPAVSILVTTWNGIDLVRACLRTVIEQTTGVDYEIILVDDASTDGTASLIPREFPPVRLVARAVNGGFVQANNDGVRLAQGRYVLLLNSDTLLRADAVSVLAGYLDDNPGVGVCGGALVTSDGTPQIAFGDEPSLAQALADAAFLNDLFPGLGFPSRGVARVPRSPRRADYVSGADLMIRRSLIDRLGLFDEAYEAYCEEVDLCRRVRTEGGMEVHIVPRAVIVHLGGVTYGSRGDRRVRIQYASYRTFLRKFHGPLYARIVLMLYGWHYAVKTLVRCIRWVIAPRARRDDRRAEALNSWAHVRQSLFQAARGGGR